jgi:hypothetical protein
MMHYNFARVHMSLRVAPAMEAGISDHIWSWKKSSTFAELVVASFVRLITVGAVIKDFISLSFHALYDGKIGAIVFNYYLAFHC